MMRFSVLCTLLCILAAEGNAILPAVETKSFSRVIAVVDVTGSFREFIPESWAKLQAFVDTLAVQKPKRWQGEDEVEIISLDADPVVVWAGKAKQLQQLKGDQLTALLKPRVQHFANLTNVRKAINLAIDKANVTPQPSQTFVLIFSDLIHEEAGSPPAISPVPPPKGIHWAQVDTAHTTFFALFVPDDQSMAWREKLPSGIRMTFKDPAEARNTALTPPQPIRQEASKADVIHAQETIETGKSLVRSGASFVWTALKWGAGGLVGVLIIAMVWSTIARRRRAH